MFTASHCIAQIPCICPYRCVQRHHLYILSAVERASAGRQHVIKIILLGCPLHSRVPAASRSFVRSLNEIQSTFVWSFLHSTVSGAQRTHPTSTAFNVARGGVGRSPGVFSTFHKTMFCNFTMFGVNRWNCTLEKRAGRWWASEEGVWGVEQDFHFISIFRHGFQARHITTSQRCCCYWKPLFSGHFVECEMNSVSYRAPPLDGLGNILQRNILFCRGTSEERKMP